MTNKFSTESVEMPDDLKSLDAELSSIQYEERASFAPELEAELALEWERLSRQAPRAIRMRHLAAAASVVLLLGTVGVPSARASLVKLMGSFQASEPVEVAPVNPSTTRPGSFQAAPFEPVVTIVPQEDPAPRTVLPLERLETASEAARTVTPARTLPEIADRIRTQALIRRHYPTELQRLGVGGAVRLTLWVQEDGTVDNVQMARGSGIPGLDRAAMANIATELRFRPATRGGEAVGTWVEFDVTFRAEPPDSEDVEIPAALPAIQAPLNLDVAPLDLALIPEWQGGVDLFAPIQREAGELLLEAFSSDDALETFGSLESILAGEPPKGLAPTQWRADVGVALEEAMARAPDNPAPLLALARIRRKQGLRTEARVLFERGLQRAIRAGEDVTPSLLAELHYERGTLIKEGWLAHRELGRVSGTLFDVNACPQARSSGGATSGPASADRLIAWNYLCPVELGDIMTEGFESLGNAESDRAVMLASFRAAVDAYPEHVGANIELLLSLTDEERWAEVLDESRRFVRASGGHPYGLLIGGLALHRLSRSEEAEGQFRLAMRGLPDSETETLLDLSLLLNDELLGEYRALEDDSRRDWERRFWLPLDPILNTEVNERAVEHTGRAAYAHLRFGDAHSDPAEVWVRYGRPAAVRVVGENAGVRTEFWDYGGGPDITFSRLGSSTAMDLTAEGRAYVDDLREVFPHRYGVAARTVFTLPGQVTRFLDAETGTLEFEVHTRVPSVLATGAGDTLDLGVFFIDPAGSRARVTSRMIRAEENPVALRIPLARTSGTVVVEVFNRTTGQAAALRESVAPLVGESGTLVSDVMVVTSAAPEADEVARNADWVDPLPLVSPVESDAVGAYFELYSELPEGLNSFGLRAEVEDRDTGVITVVPIRPAGEEGFQERWERRPDAAGSIREFLTVALTDVPPGRHMLRLVVDIHGTGVVLVSERDLDRREEQ